MSEKVDFFERMQTTRIDKFTVISKFFLKEF